MNNFEKLKEELTRDRFIDMILFNCDECPVKDECEYVDGTPDGGESSAVIEDWCAREAELANKSTTVARDFGDLVSRQYLLREYDRQHEGPPGGARKIIEEAPPATLYGYSLEHLAAVAGMLRGCDLRPEDVASMIGAMRSVGPAIQSALDMVQRQAEAAVDKMLSGGAGDE